MRLSLRMLLAAALLSGCTHHRPPAAPVDVQPLSFSDSGDTALTDRWWEAFDDPELNEVVARALANNFTVQAAYARLRAAEQVVPQTRARLLPSVSAYGSAFTGTDADDGGVRRPPIEVGVQASYELDLWGRVRAQLRGDVAQREATRADAQAAALSLTAAVVRTWIALAATREQLGLLDEQISANQDMAMVMQVRFRNGVVRQADSLRQDRLLEQTRAERVARLADLEVLEHRLAVLMGLPPTTDWGDGPDTLPEPPALPDAGVPLNLVRRRPDVRSAELTVAAANADVAVAIAEQFPQLSLRATVSQTPENAEALLTGWVSALTVNLVAPLFETGRRRAEVKRRKALLEAAVAQYGDTLLTTLQEVEDALTQNRRQGELVALVDSQVDLATRAADGLQAQYTGGLDVTYLDALSARTTSQQLRRQQIDARRVQLERRVDLFRALAGPIPESPDE